MNVSILVPAYNEEKQLAACLKSLKRQTVPCEVVVCDNNSTDRTYEIAKRHADKVVRERKQGVAHAFNAAIRGSSGNLIAFTGADSIAYPDWIERFLPYFKDPRMVACYGPLEGLERQYKPFRLFSFFERVSVKLRTSWVIGGANCIVRRDVLERVGCFDTHVNMHEDCLLFREVRRHGRIKFVKDNPIKTSIRRIDETGFFTLFVNVTKELIKLKTIKRIRDDKFVPIR